jgi:hypothetical protein
LHIADSKAKALNAMGAMFKRNVRNGKARAKENRRRAAKGNGKGKSFERKGREGREASFAKGLVVERCVRECGYQRNSRFLRLRSG